MMPINTAPRTGVEVELLYGGAENGWNKARFERGPTIGGVNPGWRLSNGGFLRVPDENDRWMWRPVNPLADQGAGEGE